MPTLVVSAALVVAQAPTARYDVVIRHGTVIDGTGAARYQADVAIAAGVDRSRRRPHRRQRRRSTIDATGQFVAPGFINIHSHATPDGLVTAVNMLTQGVTTEILNADGSGPLDLDRQLDRRDHPRPGGEHRRQHRVQQRVDRRWSVWPIGGRPPTTSRACAA